ncbi:MAG: carbohydrate porin, partial [Gallionellaceae bacterium]|nr:carbohydrate porin [Gallionellaceae bacterium]
MKRFISCCGAALLTFGVSQPARAQHDPAPANPPDFTLHTESDPGVETFAIHAQATYAWQGKPAFSSPYEGENSLTGDRAHSDSTSVTVDAGARLWRGGEVHYNLEGAAGLPFSDLHGLGGMNNGELGKAAGKDIKFYNARVFLRQTWNLGGESAAVAPDMNQLAGYQDARRVVLTLGTISVLDIFDSVSISHDPRVQFMNWSFLTHGSYDYAADARGYSRGATLEYEDGDWAVRFGRYAMPIESNGETLDNRIMTHYGDQLELEKSYSLWGRARTARLLVFRNQIITGSFDDAIADAATHGGAPDVAHVRHLQDKRGAGLSVEQVLGDNLSAFARINFADGRTETYAFAEIDHAISGGIAISGNAWNRARDSFGLAVAFNGLSAAHQRYLQLGGVGAFLGDGTLDYGTERVLEMYYNW